MNHIWIWKREKNIDLQTEKINRRRVSKVEVKRIAIKSAIPNIP